MCGLAGLVVELDEVEAADVDVDSGFMLIEFRLMNDEVRVVDRVNVVFVGVLVELDAVVDDGFVGSWVLLPWLVLTPKNDSSCPRSCRAPDDSRSEARSSFRGVPFVVSLAAFGMCRLKCGDSCCDGSIDCGWVVFTGLGVGCFLAGVGLFRAMDMMLLGLACFSLVIVVVVTPFDEGLTISNSSCFQLGAVCERLILVEKLPLDVSSFSSAACGFSSDSPFQ